MKFIFIAIFILSLATDAKGQASEAYGANQPDNFYVFVGEKISIELVPCNHEANTFPIYKEYRCKYKVVQNVYGNYTEDTIIFMSYDHYGIPAFSKYKHVLHFVGEKNGHRYQENKLYNDVYLTKTHRWAATCVRGEYLYDTSFRPEVIPFKKAVVYNLRKFKGVTKQDWHTFFSPPYFSIKGHKAKAIGGHYVDDLFEQKRQSVLKAREIFLP